MQGFEVSIERIPRLNVLGLSGLILREEVRRDPLCYYCEQAAPAFIHNGRAMCAPCRARSILRVPM
jgi:hypothetical protein